MAKSRAQTDHNQALAAIFHQMAACYRYLGSREKFRALAYDNASRTIAGLEEDVSVYAGSILQLEELKGVGESIAEKIEEYLETGRISTFEQLKKKVPVGLLELMDVNGFGPATVKILHEKLGIGNRAELLAALEGKKMEKLKGFGEKKIENMRRGLTLFAASQGRMLLWDAMHLGGEMLDDLKNISGVREAIIAGSLRRKKETIGDIDLVATADKKDWKKIIDKFTSLPAVRTVLAGGETKASILVENTNTQVDLRLVHPEEYGAALLYFTGSREHTVYLRTWAKSRGWKVNEYGVFEAKNNKKLAGASEAEIYKLFGLDYIPPELREQRGEIDAAAKKSLPLLVEEKDIRGDMHMHSTWSDGAEKIESIAGYLLKKFPAYEYMVITDHSPSERVAHGLPPRDFLRQFEEIDKINKKLGRAFIKKGVELDILADGSLDLPDDLLEKFDWVTASIHSVFSKDNTERLVAACRHPLVCCIGHPSGRLIGKREAYPVNWEKLMTVAAATGTALEINSQPLRLDLKDDLVKSAIEKGVTLTISTDAHALPQFDFMQLGVAVARRGWCSRKNILNTGPWKDVESFRRVKAGRDHPQNSSGRRSAVSKK